MEIGLADAVDAVREELLEAASRGEGQPLSFEVGPIEMEFEIELRAEAKAGGKFKAWVVSAEAEAGVSRGRTHRVAFTLTPRAAGPADSPPAADGSTARRSWTIDDHVDGDDAEDVSDRIAH
ncbi:trypco2 family protein [Kitasatospora sp. DSM 101779]|uniref:trypco2 family protein n=1 Tax=Kitasatospora sp. DSM 101779 TaxID=2853165 RepID=UPI0021D89547|nr:trypco2 family protein [Kitasatospora sp. DSM 101779]